LQRDRDLNRIDYRASQDARTQYDAAKTVRASRPDDAIRYETWCWPKNRG